MTSALSLRVQARSYERRWWILTVLCFSLLVIVLDNTILNVAIPTIVRDLDATNSQLQWMVDAYTLVFAGLLLTAGSLGDRFGRRGALQIGLVVFGIGSLASAFANSADQLIATRAFMGIGGAFIMPATLSIITNVFPPGERGKAIGVWAGTAGLAGVLGPTTGGFLLEHFYWGSVFLVNIPIVIIGILAGFFLIPTSKDPSAPRLDPIGAVLSIAGLVSLLYGIIEAPQQGWTNSTIMMAFFLGIALLAGVLRLGEPHRPPDARRQVLQEPAVHRGEPRHHVDLLRHVRHDVPHHAVLPVRARLLAVRDRHPLPPVGGGDDGRVATQSEAGRPLRDEAWWSQPASCSRHWGWCRSRPSPSTANTGPT